MKMALAVALMLLCWSAVPQWVELSMDESQIQNNTAGIPWDGTGNLLNCLTHAASQDRMAKTQNSLIF